MGFRKEPTLYRLKFEDESFEGLEVMAKSVPLKDFLALNKMSSETDSAKQVEQSEALFRKFAEALISWNLEDENGKPVPTTYNGLVSQEMAFVTEIIKAWMDAIASVPKTSKSNSNGSGTYPEVSIPMAVS
jgi:hypothetical protein